MLAMTTKPDNGLRVVLADDDLLLREGLASLLERSGFQVVGLAGDATGLPALVRDTAPDVVVVDIRMPPTHTREGLEAARVIRSESAATGILVLSAHAEVEHAMELLASGRGIGYLLKSRVTDVDEFLDTLHRIARGGSVVDPALFQELVSARRRNDRLDALSAREREVLALMAEGRSNAGIARRLWIAEGTVEKHVRSILTKLDLTDTDEDHRRVLAVLSVREREVLVLMTEGLSNAGIARRLWITEGTVEKHVRSIMAKLDLADTPDDHRRVRAVILYLDATR